MLDLVWVAETASLPPCPLLSGGWSRLYTMNGWVNGANGENCTSDARCSCVVLSDQGRC